MQPLLWRISFDVLNQRKVKCKSVCRNVVNVSLYSKKQRANHKNSLCPIYLKYNFIHHLPTQELIVLAQLSPKGKSDKNHQGTDKSYDAVFMCLNL